MSSRLTHRWTHNEVKEFLEEEGCELISQYTNAKAQLKYMHEGLTYDTTWFGWYHHNQRLHDTTSYTKKLFMKLLTDFKIKYEMNWTFSGCKISKRRLTFDFFLPEYGIVVELDHFRNGKYIPPPNGSDAIKEHYCQSNQMKLLHITPYFAPTESTIDWIDQCTTTKGQYIFFYGN
jgi:hypothetical protein